MYWFNRHLFKLTFNFENRESLLERDQGCSVTVEPLCLSWKLVERSTMFVWALSRWKKQLCFTKFPVTYFTVFVHAIIWPGRILDSPLTSRNDSQHIKPQWSGKTENDLLCHAFSVLGMSLIFVVNIAASFPYQFSLLWLKVSHKCTVSLITFFRISVALFN
jgi:hypothetical protein